MAVAFVTGGTRGIGLAVVEALVARGIPVVGHLGLTPQSVHALGGHRVQGRGLSAAEQMRTDALALESAGASAIVLELVPRDLATEISATLRIPTIGIGAGGADIILLHQLAGGAAHAPSSFLSDVQVSRFKAP